MQYIDDPDFDPQFVLDRIAGLRDRFAGSTTLSGRILFRPKRVSPPLIYKYTSASVAKDFVIPNLSMRYTQSEVLDDVFEQTPVREELQRLLPDYEDGPTFVIDISDPEDRLCKFDRVREARAQLRRSDVTISDDTAIITSDGVHREWRYELGNRQLKYAIEVVRKPLALSLTELDNSLQLWSGYADSHRGVCLGFDTRHKYFRSNRDLIDRAGYFAPIEYRNIQMEDYAYRFPYERFFIKPKEWLEQREWRRIEFVDQVPSINFDTAVFSFAFPPDALRAVVFGARCTDDDIGAIVEKVRVQSSLNHVRLSRMRLSIGRLMKEEL